jgi:hypothetical protein
VCGGADHAGTSIPQVGLWILFQVGWEASALFSAEELHDLEQDCERYICPCVEWRKVGMEREEAEKLIRKLF